MNKQLPNADAPVWLDDTTACIDELAWLTAMSTDPASVPHAIEVVHEIPVYDGNGVRDLTQQGSSSVRNIKALQEEWVRVLLEGAGVIVIRQAIDDIDMLDEVTDVLQQILNDEMQSHPVADHFAAAGSNSRIWNAHEKLCVRSPELFARYNANDVLSLVCRAWLGPAYQITAQVNVVHPGGCAQTCHRDYHLGFQDSKLLREYPAHVHTLSPVLTLQGAIAHTDVPIVSGPTQLLPFSQKLLTGYIDVADEQVREHFLKHYVQLPLSKGDMLFFNPALFHAAGDNNTAEVHRFVNLLQVGSAYGRTLEFLDRARMSIALYPLLQSMMANGDITHRGLVQAVDACAEGYPFPANIDLEPPLNGLAPASQQQLMLKGLEEGWTLDVFADRVRAQQRLKRSY